MKYDETRNEDFLTLVHTGDEYDKYLNAVVPPVFMNSLHIYDSIEAYSEADIFSGDDFIYGRVSNPTVHILERKIAELEHGSRALAFSSGMAAFSSVIMAVCRTGSHVICMKDVYTPIKRMFDAVFQPKLQMSLTFVSGNNLKEIEDAIQENTDLMILESPASFTFRVVDLAAIAELARQKGIKTYIDNTCLTPIFQKPLDLGITISMHTMSKYIGGHSDIIGGVLVSKDEELMRTIMTQAREFFGGILGPMEAWLAIRGLRTLDVRMQRLCETGMAVAEYLENHDRVKKVYYTGLASHPQADIIARQQKGHSSLLSFELDTEDVETAAAFINRLKLFGKGCSWGGHESLASLPLSKEPEAMLDLIQGSRGLIRIYCGLEGSDNLIADLEQSFKHL